MEPAADKGKVAEVISGDFTIDTEGKLLKYLACLKAGWDDPMNEKSQAFQEFLRLLEHAKQIIAAMYQKDEEEKGRAKVWKPENITPSDLEKVICNGIPINKMGNLKKMSASILRNISARRGSADRELPIF